MAVSTLGSLVLELGADIAKLRRDVGQATGVLRGFATAAQGISNQIKGLFAGIGVSALAAAGRATLQFADDIVESADAIGLSTRRFQELQFVATQSGVSIEQFRTGMGRLAKEAGEAGLSTERAFSIVVEKMRQAETQSQKVAIAQSAMGKGATQWALAFGDGGQAAEEMTEQLRRTGAVIDDSVLRRVAEVNDRIDGFVRLIEGGMVIAIDKVIPPVESLGEAFDKVKTKVSSALDQVGLSTERMGNALERWWLKIKLMIPDMTGKDALRAQLAELEQMDEVLQRLQQGARGEAGGGLKINVTLRPKRDVRDFSMSDDERAFFDKLSGATGGGTGGGSKGGGRSGLSAYEQGLDHMNDLIAEESSRLGELQSRWDAVLTPMEKATYDMAKLQEEFATGRLPLELYQREYQKLADSVKEFQAEQAQAAKGSEQLAEVGRDLGMTFSSAFEDAITQGKKFSDVLKGLAQDIARIIIRRAVTEPMAAGISSAISGAMGSGFGEWLGSLFKFQHGGSFTVGGAGGVDSSVVAFRATPGERVTVTPPGGSGTVNVNFTINSLDPRTAAAVIAENQDVITGVVRRAFRRSGYSPQMA